MTLWQYTAYTVTLTTGEEHEALGEDLEDDSRIEKRGTE